MSADNVLIITKGKIPADEVEKYYIFNTTSDEIPKVNSREEMFKFCIRHYLPEYWWNLPTYETFEDACKAADDLIEKGLVEYGVEYWCE